MLGATPIIDTDAVLVRRYKLRNERSAFEALFKKYQGPIYGLVVRLIGSEDAYDVTQDVFVRAVKALHGFRGECTFRTWLYTIARRLCYNHSRDEKRRQSIVSLLGGDADSENGEGVEQQYPDPCADVSRIAETKELQRIVAEILGTLTLEQRLLITLRDFEGMSYEEISQITEISVVNVKSKLHRARQAFKTKFAPFWAAMDGQGA
jgi:RNA polymerase sigma-70 factor (ECF subfamily)